MKKVRWVIYRIMVFSLVFGTFWAGYARKKPQLAAQEKIVPAETQAVSTGSINELIDLTF